MKGQKTLVDMPERLPVCEFDPAQAMELLVFAEVAERLKQLN